MNCHLAITRVKFVYLIDACVLRRKLNRRFHNKRRRRDPESVERIVFLMILIIDVICYWMGVFSPPNGLLMIRRY